MKKQFTEEEIAKALRRHEQGEKLFEICLEFGIENITFKTWRRNFGDLKVNKMNHLRETAC